MMTASTIKIMVEVASTTTTSTMQKELSIAPEMKARNLDSNGVALTEAKRM